MIGLAATPGTAVEPTCSTGATSHRASSASSCRHSRSPRPLPVLLVRFDLHLLRRSRRPLAHQHIIARSTARGSGYRDGIAALATRLMSHERAATTVGDLGLHGCPFGDWLDRPWTADRPDDRYRADVGVPVVSAVRGDEAGDRECDEPAVVADSVPLLRRVADEQVLGAVVGGEPELDVQRLGVADRLPVADGVEVPPSGSFRAPRDPARTPSAAHRTWWASPHRRDGRRLASARMPACGRSCARQRCSR